MFQSLINFATDINITANEVGIPTTAATASRFNSILGLIYAALAAICLFYVIRGALLYVTHGAEPNAQKEARETIIYAILALVGSSMVFPLIWFVVNSVVGGPSI